MPRDGVTTAADDHITTTVRMSEKARTTFKTWAGRMSKPMVTVIDDAAKALNSRPDLEERLAKAGRDITRYQRAQAQMEDAYNDQGRRLNSTCEQLAECRAEIAELHSELEDARYDNRAYRRDLDRLHSRTLWQRIRNK